MVSVYQKGLHVLMDREHFRSLPVEKRFAETLAYIEQTQAGIEPMKCAAMLIMKEFRS